MWRSRYLPSILVAPASLICLAVGGNHIFRTIAVFWRDSAAYAITIGAGAGACGKDFGMAASLDNTIYEPIVAAIDAEMRTIRAEQQPVAPLLWEIVDYQFGWDLPLDAVEERRRVAGKKIRSLLMALVAQAVGGDYAPVLPAAAALELLHNFTLIHDDVMDNSQERRHRLAVWTRWGMAQAINVGDGLYALANVAMARLLRAGVPATRVVRASEALSQACLWTCEGQVLDISFETRGQVSPDEYITMIAHKSGTLIEAAARIGALLTTGDEAVIDRKSTRLNSSHVRISYAV